MEYSTNICKCGCSGYVKQDNTYINGHNSKINKNALKHGMKKQDFIIYVQLI